VLTSWEIKKATLVEARYEEHQVVRGGKVLVLMLELTSRGDCKVASLIPSKRTIDTMVARRKNLQAHRYSNSFSP
jgi:hypothetical protein